jgi:hypothetical protein
MHAQLIIPRVRVGIKTGVEMVISWVFDMAETMQIASRKARAEL